MKTRNAFASLLVLLVLTSVSWAQPGRVYIPTPRVPAGGLGGVGGVGAGLGSGLEIDRGGAIGGLDKIDVKPDLTLKPDKELEFEGDPLPQGNPLPPSRPQRRPKPKPAYRAPYKPQPPVKYGGDPPQEETRTVAPVPEQDDERDEVEVETALETSPAIEESLDPQPGEWTWMGRIGVALGIFLLLGLLGAIFD